MSDTINDFYSFGTKLAYSTFQAVPVGVKCKVENGLSDPYKLIMGDFSDIDFPVIFKQESGKKLHDILETGLSALYLISDKMKNVLIENQLTGWKTFPVKIFDKKDNEVLGYEGFSTTGRAGPLDYSKCPIIETRVYPSAPLVKHYVGKYIDLSTWDGSDFFLPKNHFGTMITPKAAQILTKSKLTNINLRRLGDIETPLFAVR
jgi:hypothetical protein